MAKKPVTKKTPDATAKPPSGKWFNIETGTGEPLVFGPAEAIIAWNGSKRTGRFILQFDHWDRLDQELPPRVRPSGDPVAPQLIVDDEKSAKAALAEYEAFLRARHPKLRKKTSGGETMFLFDEYGQHDIGIAPETAAHVVLRAHDRETVMRESVLLWWVHNQFVLLRATGDVIEIVDARKPQPPAELTGEATPLGTVACQGLFVGLWAPLAVTDLKKIDKATVAALAPLANKGPLSPRDSNAAGDGIVFSAEGAFTVETGGDAATRWLRFRRAAGGGA